VNGRSIALAFLALSFSFVDAQNPVAAASAELDSMALYCMQVHRLSLAQLEHVYAGIPGSAESPGGRDQLAKHRARVANAEKYVKARIEQMERSHIDEVMGKATADFRSAANDTNACIQSCPDDRCRAQCIAKPSPATRRVDSCVHRVW
jgi:hypothetical protein